MREEAPVERVGVDLEDLVEGVEARWRDSMPLSRCRTSRAIVCERASSRANQAERSKASRHWALV
jgi:hypothetical protein